LHRSFALIAFPIAFLVASVPAGAGDSYLRTYRGTPFHDSRYPGGGQRIPGKVMCAYYDLGGEGVAYHDNDAKNHGSGELNPADGSYLNEFRMGEGVDISYTKFGRDPQIDDTQYDKAKPDSNLLYVGWTEPGEWFNITVNVATTGDYSADLLYTSNRGGTLALDVNGIRAADNLQIASTYDAADPVAWRQWHHWNLAAGLARLHLSAGRNVITVHIVTSGQMNLATLDFKKAN
jgi:hypothetical protein